MRHIEAEFKARNIAIVVVTFERVEVVKDYAQTTGVEWPILIDSDRKLYQAYGMERGSVNRVMGPGSWWKYLQLMRAGYKVHRPTDDIYQLGGDVLVDASGRVRHVFVSKTPVDRPAMDVLLREFDR